MKVKRAYRYRFYPTPEQAQNLACTFGCVRFMYNWALSKRKRAYFDQGVKLCTKELAAEITALKKEEGRTWIKEVSSVPLQQALRHLDSAYKNFFEGRADYPTFKKKHHEQSATYTDNAFTLKDEKLTLAKHTEPLDIVWSRPLPDGAKPSSVTVSKDRSGRYFVSIVLEEEIAPLPLTEQRPGKSIQRCGLGCVLPPVRVQSQVVWAHLHQDRPVLPIKQDVLSLWAHLGSTHIGCA